MINNWIIDNFKSINEEKKLTFRPLTIFTGANSSGKSTILQSILLVTQTLQSPQASRSIVLNGWFKKFGSYSDIVNKREYQKNIKIGFSIMDNSDEFRSRRTPWGEEVETVNCEFEIESNQQDEDLQPTLAYMQLTTKDSNDNTSNMTITHNAERSELEKEVINSNMDSLRESELEYRLETDLRSRRLYYGGYSSDARMAYFAATLNHFLPEYLIAYYGNTSKLKQLLSRALMEGEQYAFRSIRFDDADMTPIREKAITIVDNIYKKRVKKTKALDTAYMRFKAVQNIENLYAVFRSSGLKYPEKIKYIETLHAEFDKLPETYSVEREPGFFYAGVEFVKGFFCDNIKYLGPLREEPKSLYPLEGGSSTLDIGLKGENTASVFDNHKKRKIKYISPSYYKELPDYSPNVKEDTLYNAINEWLIYLDVAKDINSNDRGKFGHELKIVNEIKGMKQDLTHVGVGVSQILPILVLCFLAKKGDTIILEQPELHLHPKVQTRLADFFVSMNALGKQCIIETHSEYLINRLRLLVAKVDDTKIADETMIYFVEKDKKEGYSKYREITINKYGKIDKWPDGFFDEGEDLASQIVRASFEKKKREKLKVEK